MIERCWEGRIVGDNAINRVISLLRQLASGLGENSFAIETVTKVGYRLAAANTAEGVPTPTPFKGSRARFLNRRKAVVTIACVGISGAAYLGWRSVPSSRRKQALLPYERGLDLQSQGTGATQQAIAYFQRAVEIDPDFADAWGALALLLARLAPPGDAASRETLSAVRTAAAKAIAIDPDNRNAKLALILVAPYLHNWAALERETRAAIKAMPDVNALHSKLGSVLCHVGRFRESARELSPAVEKEPLVPAYQIYLWRTLWGMDRIADAQSLIDRAFARWPDNLDVWISRFTLLTFCGEVAQMTAMSGRGSIGRTDDNPLPIDLGLHCARAFAGADASVLREAGEAVWAAITQGEVASFLGIPLLSALGLIDRAFAAAYDFYLGKHDPISGERAIKAGHPPRMTYFLFQPPIAPMRADPRFPKLTDAIGLADYWRETASRPDYLAR